MSTQPDFERMYVHLFRAVTQALELLEQGQASHAVLLLARAQCETEERYMDADSPSEEDAAERENA